MGFKSNKTFGQYGQWGLSQVKQLIKMANVIIVKWGILLTYLPYSITFLPTYQPIDLPTTTYLPTYLPTYNLPTFVLTYLCIFLPTTIY